MSMHMVFSSRIKLICIINRILLLFIIYFTDPIYACHILLCNNSLYKLVVSGDIFFGIKQHQTHTISVVNAYSKAIVNYGISQDTCITVIDLRKKNNKLIDYAGLRLNKLSILVDTSRSNILKRETYIDFLLQAGDARMNSTISINLASFCPSNINKNVVFLSYSHKSSNNAVEPHHLKSKSISFMHKGNLQSINEKYPFSYI